MVEIPVATIYARETYLTVRLLLICDHSISRKLVEYMGKNYEMGQENYPSKIP